MTPPNWKKSAPQAILLICVTLAAFSSTFRAGFVWDDDQHILQNFNLRDTEGLARIWFVPSSSPQYYPMAHSSWWLEYQLWGLAPAGYHVDNVLLQVLNGLLLWVLLRRLRIPGAWFAAALFAVHPLQVETVAWIMERKNLLSCTFYLLSFLALMRFFSVGFTRPKIPVRKIYYAMGVLCFILALLSKSVAATLPAAFLLIVWWQEGRLSRKHWLGMLPLFVLGIASGVFTAYLEWTRVGANGSEYAFSTLGRFLIAGRAAWTYAYKLVWPHPLMLFYPRWAVDAGAIAQYAFLAGVIGVLGTLWWKRKAWGTGPLVVVLFFLGTLFPALGFLNVFPMRYSFVADHFQYMACISLFTLVAAGLAKAADKWPRLRASIVIFQGCWIAALVALTFFRGFAFQDAKALYEDLVRKNPESYAGHALLGREFMRQADFSDALVQFAQAKELRPDLLDNWEMLGNTLLANGRVDEALKTLEYLSKARTRTFDDLQRYRRRV